MTRKSLKSFLEGYTEVKPTSGNAIESEMAALPMTKIFRSDKMSRIEFLLMEALKHVLNEVELMREEITGK